MSEYKLQFHDFDVRTITLTCEELLNRFRYTRRDIDENLKSDIIESILLRIPINNICIHEDSHGEHIFIGEHIIQTIEEFYSNSFKLTTDIIPFETATYYKDMHRSVQRRIDQTYIDFVVLDTWNDDLDYTIIKHKMKTMNGRYF